MRLDDALRDLILKQASTNVVREEAKKRGMRSLRDSGLLAVFDGVTTIEEVVKATAVEQ
jgi:type IV pilus assembly protein PilB